ncbi:CRISPR-associated helicase Cas3' [Amycolatopsis granulosa]|uniref:CRISPR-associated helicase Cas3' n=1 Tax=Amycolatopsis granulosa TaxID=185684 RepID=UPI00141FC4B1|nr:CRISPR-associated helicase Cas3' [Amycolatopsis granulosa]NIH83765.1 CRISPR-associated helicase Cas3/CRISPR-associated endonuclease Cas3-HD [Amycolatopsis granulosa]
MAHVVRGLTADAIGKAAWLSSWAKSVTNDRGELTGWLPLWLHLMDSATVAGLLVDRWVSRQALDLIGKDLPGGSADVRFLACWLAGVHDIGKLSPAFAVQVDFLADRMQDAGLSASPLLKADPQRSRTTHSLVGFGAVRTWLSREAGFERAGLAAQLASVVASHHGVAPEQSQVAALRQVPHLTGTGVWDVARTQLLEFVTGRVGGHERLASLAGVRLGRPAMVLLTGIVIMADWIASNAELFPLWPMDTANAPGPVWPEEMLEARVAHAWAELALPPRWTPSAVGPDLDAEFASRFPHIDVARPAQAAVVEMARAQAGGGIVVAEAPMGVGKTEAALIAAEVLARGSGADGVFVALPTQATTNAMFSRVLDWLQALPGSVGGAAVHLAHGKAALNDEYTGLLSRGDFACVGADEDDAVAVHQWMRGSKKGPLAPFVVGTIDQILVAALKCRHVMLRHLALAGKVVVIDEVHAYDVYMSVYLRRVLQWLGAYQVPVVLLSATLPAERRRDLLNAYHHGRTGRDEDASVPAEVGYPMVSSAQSPAVVVPSSESPVRVALDRLPDDLDALATYLRRHLADGGCAAVIRNTVARVQETADRLVAEFGEDAITVNHAHFLGCDRAELDEGLVRRFGRDGAQRPHRHVVVASQVLEQSLDVDFDLLVTDLAPVDLVLQRLGRLHRHQRTRPAPLVAPRCALTGVEDWTSAPVRAVAGARRVYAEHPLLRAAALLHDLQAVELPTDIDPLVQHAYGSDNLGPASWQDAIDAAAKRAEQDAERRAAKAEVFLLGSTTGPGTLVGWLQAGVGDADGPRGAAQVRDGAESIEVLVVQRDEHGGLLTPDWIATGASCQVPLDDRVPSWLARIIAGCSLRLPLAMSHPGVADAVITDLEAHRFTSFDRSPLLAGQLVLVLDQTRRALVRAGNVQFDLAYQPRRGLSAKRI